MFSFIQASQGWRTTTNCFFWLCEQEEYHHDTARVKSSYVLRCACKRHAVEGGQLFYMEHKIDGSTEEEKRRRKRVFMEHHGCSFSYLYIVSVLCERLWYWEYVHFMYTCTCMHIKYLNPLSRVLYL